MPLKFAQSWLLFAVFETRLRAVDLGLEALGHACVALGGREVDTLLKRFDRARYVALAEKGPGFAKDASIALAFCGGIHEDYRK
jgi:hypothetical protein